jgi:hypothetical protein
MEFRILLPEEIPEGFLKEVSSKALLPLATFCWEREGPC